MSNQLKIDSATTFTLEDLGDHIQASTIENTLSDLIEYTTLQVVVMTNLHLFKSPTEVEVELDGQPVNAIGFATSVDNDIYIATIEYRGYDQVLSSTRAFIRHVVAVTERHLPTGMDEIDLKECMTVCWLPGKHETED